MNKQNFAYVAAIALLALGFNIALIAQVKTGKGWPLAIVCLLFLFVLIVFRNRKLYLTQWGRMAAVSLVGVALTATSDIAAIVYAISGLLVLMLIQFRVVVRGNPNLLLLGGNPLHKLDAVELALAKLGLSMLVSVMLTFLIKLAWLANAV